MQAPIHAAHPFALLTDPQSILRAVEGSRPLHNLKRIVCRPLDKAPARQGMLGDDVADYDAAIDGGKDVWRT